MATKKSAQSRAGKKRTSKKGRKKPSRKPDFQANPPIVVGGGGSTIIWMRKSLSPVEIDPATLPAAAPRPNDPSLYKCFKCNVDIHVATVTKGIGGIPVVFTGMSAGRCIITFDA
jgi:hypothetical protein